jgi:hypothetical protein
MRLDVIITAEIIIIIINPCIMWYANQINNQDLTPWRPHTPFNLGLRNCSSHNPLF